MDQNIGNEPSDEKTSAQNRVLLIGCNDTKLGLMVDSVIQIGKLDIDNADARDDFPKDEAAAPLNTNFIWKLTRAEDKTPIPVLDIPRLVDYVTGISGMTAQK